MDDINLQTKVAALLDHYPDLEEILLALSPAFAKLRNPVLRRTVAKVTNLQQAANIAGISPVLLVQRLREAARLDDHHIEETDGHDGVQENQPAWFDETGITVRFDAGPVIAAGESPMQQIIRLSRTLKQGEIMELNVPFKPVPIIDLLRSKKFKVWYGQGKTYLTPG